MRFIIGTGLVVALLAFGGRSMPNRITTALDSSVRAAAGPVIQNFPGELPGAPMYALLGRGYIPADDGWVGILFTRSTECVPAAFNLLDQFDIPTAFGCQLTVEGESWRHDASDPVPFQIHERGTGAVPVYFVAQAEFQDATADDVLTIAELQGLPSLQVGLATFLEHVVHNTTSNQGTNHGHEALVAFGQLTDGRSFQFRFNEKFFPETGQHVFPDVKIQFD
jgi:hypothetical protein